MHHSQLSATHVPTTLSGEAFHAIVRFLRLANRRRKLVLASLGICVTLGAAYYLTAQRVYQANSRILVERTGSEIMPGGSTIDSDNQTLVANHQALISQPKVLEAAAESLRSLGDLSDTEFKDIPFKDWTEVLAANLTTQTVHRTNLIQLSYRAHSPAAAEQILEEIKNAYLAFVEKHHKSTSGALLETLRSVQGDVEQKLLASQEHLLEVRRRVKALGIEEGAQVVHPAVQRVLQLNENLVEIQKQRVELQASYASLQDAIAQGSDLRQYLAVLNPEVAQMFVSSSLGLSSEQSQAALRLQQQLADDTSKLQSMQAHLGPTHPEYLELVNKINNAQAYLNQLQANSTQRLEQIGKSQLGPMLQNMLGEKLAKTVAHEKRLLEQYQQSEDEAVRLNDGLAELTVAQRTMDRQSKLHETLMGQIANIDIGQNRSGILVSVTGEPTATLRAVSPRLSLIVFLSVAGGLGIGMGLVYITDLLDDRFRSPDEMQDQLSLPLLTVIGQIVAPSEHGLDAIAVHHSPTAVETEPFRTLRTSVLLGQDSPPKIAITSTEPGDGKTTIISNLAASLAQAGRRVIAIDADMRKPGLSKLMQMRGLDGLSNILDSDQPIDAIVNDLIVPSGMPGLDFIPCGIKPPDPSELLARAKFSELLAWAERHYDNVLIDCPPVLVASDTIIVSRQVEGVILVVQPQKNPRRLVTQATDTLRKFDAPLLGLVANRIQEDAGGGYSGYGYGYGYGYGDDDVASVADEDIRPLVPNPSTDDRAVAVGYPNDSSKDAMDDVGHDHQGAQRPRRRQLPRRRAA
jgi:capsular exopolysaccharide synthesis family protein